jgi:TRAP-type C4-dicarboxylate transport system substrate-binding protein
MQPGRKFMKGSDRISRRTALTGLAAAGTAAAWPLIRGTAHAQPKAEHTMVFAHTFSQATEKYVVTGIDLFKQLAEKYSEGRLLVDVHEGGKLGGQNVLPQKVQQGAIQATQLSTQNFTPFSEAYNMLDFPYLFKSNAAFEKFLSDPGFMETALGKEPTDKGLKVLAGMWANSGLRVFGVSKKAGRGVRLPQDLKGLKVRVTASKVEQQAFALTPASPVSINWAETYQAIQQGTADALHVGLGPLTSARIHEVLGTATKLGMNFNAHVAVVGNKWFDALPAKIQDAIDRAARESWAYQQTEQRKADEGMWAEWKARGIEVIELTPDERKQWVSAVGHQRPEWAQWKERYGKALYDKIVELGEKLG